MIQYCFKQCIKRNITVRRRYKLIDNGVAESKHDGGVFVTTVRPVLSKEDALKFIEEVRQRHSNATHNCWAYRLEDSSRSNDDGEVGSPGKAILKRIESEGFTNVAVVVTRYFGGKKVGMSRVSQLFYNSAKDGLLKIDRATQEVQQTLCVVTSTINKGGIERSIAELNLSLNAEEHLPDGQNMMWTITSPEHLRDKVQSLMEENCKGRVKIKVLETKGA